VTLPTTGEYFRPSSPGLPLAETSAPGNFGVFAVVARFSGNFSPSLFSPQLEK